METQRGEWLQAPMPAAGTWLRYGESLNVSLPPVCCQTQEALVSGGFLGKGFAWDAPEEVFPLCIRDFGQ